MVKCKKCKTSFDENYMNFCPSCGEVLPKEKNVSFNAKNGSAGGLSKLFGLFKKK